MATLKTNALYYGDNLTILRNHCPDECIDLVYLDPPFNSRRDYNIFFADRGGKESQAQVKAFEDTWCWTGEVEHTFQQLVTEGRNQTLVDLVEAFRSFMGESDLMAYLTMMAIRLQELHRVLKPTGSLYLHCDPSASHYLKVVLDAIFGGRGFRNEITWKRTSAHGDSRKRFANISDSILLYTNTDSYTFNRQYLEYSQDYIDQFYRYFDDQGRRYRLDNMRSPNPRPNLVYEYKGYKPHPNGWIVAREKMEELDRQGRLNFPKDPNGRISKKLYLDEMPGVVAGDIWTDISPIGAQAAERLGYPTQKPLALLERIIQASSNEGDLVLDPFCGCGTAVVAAHKLKRRWVGIDITHLATSLMKGRLESSFPELAGQIEVVGIPKDLDGARNLAHSDRYEFQYWVCTLIGALPPAGANQKGADRGIDGIINFFDLTGKPQRIIVSVKSGHVQVKDVRELIQVVSKREAALGLFITLEPPTGPLTTEAVSAGFFQAGGGVQYPKIQVLTVEQLLHGQKPQYPAQVGGVANVALKQAQEIEVEEQTAFAY